MQNHWRFGEDQTAGEEYAEIRQAQAAGLEVEYLEQQRFARLRESETARKRVRRGRPTPPAPVEEIPPARRVSHREIEAARTRRGGWSRRTLEGWGVPWPPPKGWRKALERGERPHGWSTPTVVRQASSWPARSHTKQWTTPGQFQMVREAMVKMRRCRSDTAVRT